MSKAHYMAPLAVLRESALTVRLGANAAGKFLPQDVGKFVKLAGESQYDLCAAGDPMEQIVLAVDTALSGGQSVGAVIDDGLMFVLADGIQATPGTGTIAIGDYVVCGTVTAKGTILPLGIPKVCKATLQPGTDPASTAAASNLIKQSLYAWRVESLGVAGTGAVGSMIAIRRVNA